MSNIRLRGVVNLINGNNKGVMTTQITIRDLLEIYTIDKTVNRDINYSRLSTISKYIDTFDAEMGVFLPSLVLTFNGDVTKYYDFEEKQLVIPTSEKLKVVDGQHRIKGLEYLLNSNTEFNRKEKILDSYLTAQIYFGLSEKNQRDIFVDINSNSKRVSMSLVTKYDTRDIMRVLVNDLYNNSNVLQNAGVEFNKSRTVRPNSKLLFTSARLKNFIAILLFGRSNVSKKNENLVKDNYDDILTFLDKFFVILLASLPPTPGDVRKYALGHEALQNGIALYLHKSIILEVNPQLIWLPDWVSEVERLVEFNWHANNPLFQPHMITSKPNTEYEFKKFVDGKHDEITIIIEKELL